MLVLRYLPLLALAVLVDNYYGRSCAYEHGSSGWPLPRLGHQFLMVVLGVGSW